MAMMHNPASPGELLKTAILKTEGPVLFIENKVLYAQMVQHGGDGVLEVEEHEGGGGYPLVRVTNFRAGAKSDQPSPSRTGL